MQLNDSKSALRERALLLPFTVPGRLRSRLGALRLLASVSIAVAAALAAASSGDDARSKADIANADPKNGNDATKTEGVTPTDPKLVGFYKCDVLGRFSPADNGVKRAGEGLLRRHDARSSTPSVVTYGRSRYPCTAQRSEPSSKVAFGLVTSRSSSSTSSRRTPPSSATRRRARLLEADGAGVSTGVPAHPLLPAATADQSSR